MNILNFFNPLRKLLTYVGTADAPTLYVIDKDGMGEIAKAHADASSALRNLESSQRLLDAAQKALDNVHRKYDKGISDILEMLNVQASVADAGHERIRALSEWRSARLRLLANAGTVGFKDVR